MGIVSILLGIIAFFCFTGSGAILAIKIREAKDSLAQSVEALDTVSNTALIAVIIAVFAFIGLLIAMNLIMHGITFRKKQPGSSSMGMISILLGIITFCCFTLMGVYIANMLVPYKELISMFQGMSFLNTTSDAIVYSVIIGLFAFIGLLICVNHVMHGLTYKKVAKLQGQLRRR